MRFPVNLLLEDVWGGIGWEFQTHKRNKSPRAATPLVAAKEALIGENGSQEQRCQAMSSLPACHPWGKLKSVLTCGVGREEGRLSFFWKSLYALGPFYTKWSGSLTPKLPPLISSPEKHLHSSTLPPTQQRDWLLPLMVSLVTQPLYWAQLSSACSPPLLRCSSLQGVASSLLYYTFLNTEQTLLVTRLQQRLKTDHWKIA